MDHHLLFKQYMDEEDKVKRTTGPAASMFPLGGAAFGTVRAKSAFFKGSTHSLLLLVPQAHCAPPDYPP